MSSKLRPLLQQLLERVSRSAAPVFHECELLELNPAGLQLLKKERVLMDGGIAAEVEHSQYGSMIVRECGSGWVLVDPENPGRDLVPVAAERLRLLRFNHAAMMSWIARTNGMAGESVSKGEIWTVGTTDLNGSRCRVLYYPGTASREELLLALRSFTAESSGDLHLLLIPAAIKLPVDDLAWLESKRLCVENLYRLAVDGGFDLSKARIPQQSLHRGPESRFRRSAAGWELAFNSTPPRAVPDKAGMVQIWFLLRNPQREFTATAINNELAATTTLEPSRTSGSRAKTVADLPTTVKKELRALRSEMTRAREDKDDRGLIDADEEYKRILKEHGVKDVFAGKAKREGDDAAKEADALRKAIDRSIADLRKTPELRGLAQHLHANLKRGARFSYEPPELPSWRTT